MKCKIIESRTERSRELFSKFFSKGEAIKRERLLNFKDCDLKTLKDEVHDITNVHQLANSIVIKQEINRLIRLLRFEVPCASEYEFEVVISVGTQEINLAMYVVQVYYNIVQ